MPIQVLMPKLGLTMTEGTVQRWLVSEGDSVKAGQVLFEVETEKAVTEIEAQASGIVGRLLVAEGELAPVGAVIGWLLKPGESAEALPIDPVPTGSASPVAREEAPSPTTIAAVPAADTLVRASPIARKLAKELGVDLSTVRATGPGGRIVEEDVRAAAARQLAPAPAPAAGRARSVPLRGVRRLIAERMHSSLQNTAQLTLMREVDATALMARRKALNAARPAEQAISYNALFIFLLARALQQHPDLNARLENDTLVQLPAIHIGLAADTERGLVVPVVHKAGTQTLDQISASLRHLLEALRHNRLTPTELSGSTFTLSNLGAYGVDAFTPILNPPEVGILGVGRIQRKVVVLDDEPTFTVRHRLTLSLTFDHRLVDGAPAARFLDTLTRLIETPPTEAS